MIFVSCLSFGDMDDFLIWCAHSAIPPFLIFEKEAGAGHSESYRWRRLDFPPRRILCILLIYLYIKYTYMWPSKLNCCLKQKPWRRVLLQKIPDSLPLFSLEKPRCGLVNHIGDFSFQFVLMIVKLRRASSSEFISYAL